MNARTALAVLALTFPLAVTACGGDATESSIDPDVRSFGHGVWDILISNDQNGVEVGWTTIRTCVNSSNPAPGFNADPHEMQCSVSSHVENSLLTWRQTCTVNGSMLQSDAQLTYDAAGETFQGDVTNRQDGKQVSTLHVNGHRVGDC
jgi:hypothetical protein